MAFQSLGHRRELRFWGWGYEDEQLTPDETKRLTNSVKTMTGQSPEEVSTPRIEDFDLRAPRIAPPESLAEIVSDSAYDRLTHAYGKSTADCARMILRDVPHPPDLVAFPRNEQEIIDILDWASAAGCAAIPFGGGTSVCGGVEPDVGDDYPATVSIDTQHLNQVLEIDRVSRAARIQSGANGPELEDQLRPHGLTLRHFPQSFQHSTVGGWIVTRAGGHYASVYTHIDDFVESTRTITPAGLLETRRLPGSGAGPSADRMILGSEGTLGIVTEAWLRLQDRPTHRASASIQFTNMPDATEAVRVLTQSALFPTNCRLLDPAETHLNHVGDGSGPVMVLGFESADHPVEAWMNRALEIVRDHNGTYDDAAVRASMGQSDAGPKAGADVSAWRNAFLRMPYSRNLLVPLGIIADTFETAITWDKFEDFYAGVLEHMNREIQRITGMPGLVTCRFTHVYPDGPAPYFTFMGVGTMTGDTASLLARWREIKMAANEIVVKLGGTATHHHAIGRDHRSGYEAQTSPLFRGALAAAKQSLDPAGILNPGVLYDPIGKDVGITGILRDA